jgi:hypothetical protein
MSKKSNVHPDYYKTAGRDRPDDAARARLNRAIAAKSTSQQRPDRMSKGFYFERPEPEQPEPADTPAQPARKKNAPRAGAAKKTGSKKPAIRKATAARRTASARKTASTAPRIGRKTKRPAKER